MYINYSYKLCLYIIELVYYGFIHVKKETMQYKMLYNYVYIMCNNYFSVVYYNMFIQYFTCMPQQFNRYTFFIKFKKLYGYFYIKLNSNHRSINTRSTLYFIVFKA